VQEYEPPFFAPISLYFPTIESLCLSKIFLSDEDAVVLLKSAPPTLRHIDLSLNPISSKTLAEICQSTLKDKLETVCLRACRCINTGDGAGGAESFYFSELFTSLPNLKTLDISQCFQLGENDFHNLTLVEPPTSVARNLASLHLSNCHKITNITLSHLSMLGTRYSLKNLYLSGCGNVSDEVLVSLVDWFPLLEIVDLSGTKTVLTSDDVKNVNKKSPKLKFRTSAFNFYSK